MGSLFLGVLLCLIGLGAFFFAPKEFVPRKIVGSVVFAFGLVVSAFGGVGYNDAGYCQHVRTVMGTESSTCKTGWFFLGWGQSTEWPHWITVAHTNGVTGESSGTAFQGSISGPYPVRLADNWNGDVTQTTRFGIPQDSEQFIKMARDFRSPEYLISTTLRPAVTSSLDSVSNLFSMEEYYAGGKRDQFKTEFRDAIIKGRAQVRQVTSTMALPQQRGASPNDLAAAQDTSDDGDVAVRRTIMEKILVNGTEVREPHGYMSYGISVSSAILENLDPDDRFEEQIQARKDAASRRIVAQEQRKEQEEQRLLAIQTGKTEVAKRQATAEVEQIQKTTDAETSRKLALIKANQMKEEATVAKQTSQINLERAEIDSQARQVRADAEAYEKRVILEADNALQAKLDALVKIQKEWAIAAANINVPDTVFMMGDGSGGGGTTGNFSSVESFMTLLTANAAKQLNVDTSIAGVKSVTE